MFFVHRAGKLRYNTDQLIDQLNKLKIKGKQLNPVIISLNIILNYILESSAYYDSVLYKEILNQ